MLFISQDVGELIHLAVAKNQLHIVKELIGKHGVNPSLPALVRAHVGTHIFHYDRRFLMPTYVQKGWKDYNNCLVRM